MRRRPDPMLIVSSIRHLDPHIECGSDEWVAYALLLASAVAGPDEGYIAKFMHIERERVGWMADNLRRNGVWKDGKINCEWFRENGGSALVLDVNVALGRMERAA